MSKEQMVSAPPPRRISGVAVIRDSEGSVLLVRNRYAATMRLPGARAENGESADLACTRGVLADVGIKVPCDTLMTVDYAPAAHAVPESHCFVFNGGTLEYRAPSILINGDLGHFEWSPPKDLSKYIPLAYERRVRRALDQCEGGGILYLWQGGIPDVDRPKVPAFSSMHA
ncbi:NUDIX domain-containing protein [Streptomyces sp. NPDC127108]|uniref:NUDIX domain-containing protein n=1 Tax=Streptomyces sp. NPDC127108 TaxID=3345361 RepID=UPI00363EC8D5